jgi:hypothetical protein
MALKRKPRVLRPRLNVRGLQRFVENLKALVGRPYDYMKTLKLWVQLFAHKFSGLEFAQSPAKPTAKVICTEAVMDCLPGGRGVLQTHKQNLDFGKFNIPSVNDFLVLTSHNVFQEVPLPFPYQKEGTENNSFFYRLKVIRRIRELHEVVSTVKDGFDMRRKKYKRLYLMLWACAYALKSESLPSHQLFSLVSGIWPKL